MIKKSSKYKVDAKSVVDLNAEPTSYSGSISREDGENHFKKQCKRLKELQGLLYADGKQSLLVVFQAMDAGGKDSTIRHVLGPLNPQGCRVSSFKAPNKTEASHDFLWRIHQNVPAKGMIGIFNRSHYEDVLIARVKNLVPLDTVKKRYVHINNFEKMLADEGVQVRKFYLHISKDYQKARFQRRLDKPEKNWKFNPDDLKERKLWNKYRDAFNLVLNKTSTEYAPWYIVPAETRWFRDLLVAQILIETLQSMKLKYPIPDFDINGVHIV